MGKTAVPKPKRHTSAAPREAKPRTRAPVLTDQARAFIVTSLATYQPVCTVRREVMETYGLDVSKQSISQYNPENQASTNMAKKWKDMFHVTRESYLDEVAREPIAIQIHRLRRLSAIHDKLYEATLSETDTARMIELSVEARGILEQAAKEVGGLFTNVVKNTGRVEHAHLHAITTIDEKRNMLSERLQGAMKLLPPAKAD